MGPLEGFLNFFSESLSEPAVEVGTKTDRETDHKEEESLSLPSDDLEDNTSFYDTFFYDTVDAVHFGASSDEDCSDDDGEIETVENAPIEAAQILPDPPQAGIGRGKMRFVSHCPCKLCKIGYNVNKTSRDECHECLYPGCRRMFMRRENLYKHLANREEHPLLCPGKQCDKKFRKTAVSYTHLTLPTKA